VPEREGDEHQRLPGLDLLRARHKSDSLHGSSIIAEPATPWPRRSAGRGAPDYSLGHPRIHNPDLQPRLASIAARLSFSWLRSAVRKVDELADLLRRNIQKNLALDALVLELRG
jgi:hypothetical protein